jgi:hypothetical protein
MTRFQRRTVIVLLTGVLTAAVAPQALALIEGGAGNNPIRDPGWPDGAAALINHPGRIAYWVGPPFGGGQWHAECRGDSKALSAVLAGFARLDVKSKRVILHDGVGNSFWLNPNDEPAKRANAKMDWSFTVWQKGSWEQLRKLPADFNPIDPKDAANGPPAQLDVYTGGNVDWDDVNVPKGLTIVDQRLEAHGFTVADGIVLDGKVMDLAANEPLTAKVMLQRVEPQPKGGYQYPVVTETLADAKGRWLLKNVAEGWYRVVVESPGYLTRVAGYAKFSDQPRWQAYETGLARVGPVAGRVTDDAGKPLADVQVRFGNVAIEGRRYDTPGDNTVKTDKQGRFRAEQVPIGKATIWVHKPGYVRPGLGEPITTPKSDVELRMIKAARLEVTVDFTGTKRPEAYIVQMEPEGGSKIGSYGGSGNINAKNQMTFDTVPPGNYIITGRPNPGSTNQEADPLIVQLKGGETTKVTLQAK